MIHERLSLRRNKNKNGTKTKMPEKRWRRNTVDEKGQNGYGRDLQYMKYDFHFSEKFSESKFSED